jgi:hypothetical protein
MALNEINVKRSVTYFLIAFNLNVAKRGMEKCVTNRNSVSVLFVNEKVIVLSMLDLSSQPR